MGMGIGSVTSAASSAVSGASQWQQNRQSFSQLAQAISSGDLNSAQQAYQSLAANSPQAANPNSLLAQVGQALKTGSVDAAQQALSALQSGASQQAANITSAASTSTTNLPLATSGSVGTNVNVLV